MSDFPKGGDIEKTRAWLDEKRFVGLFIGFDADTLLGMDKADILHWTGNEFQGTRLWGILNTARRTPSPDLKAEDLRKDLVETIGKNLVEKIGKGLVERIGKDLEDRIGKDLEDRIGKDLEDRIGKDLEERIGKTLGEKIRKDLQKSFHRQFKALDELVEAKENAREASIASVIGVSCIATSAILVYFKLRDVSIVAGSIAFLGTLVGATSTIDNEWSFWR